MDFQQVASLAIVGVAASVVARRVYGHLRGTAGGHCAGCGECGRTPRPDVRPAPKATPLVSLSLAAPPRRFKPPSRDT